ncbi:VanZ family protein [Butyrivibrio sp. AE3004]|uniref:VanZ family protein n=1 Tax=Butyrivibrio sp. AE3004 TaxID=1506994 RepID=UPI003FA4BAC2
MVFACIMLLFTIFRREPGSKSERIYTHLNLGFSRSAIYSENQIIYCIFNILLFVPWGIILSLYRKREFFFRIVIMTSLTGFLSSFFIEILQRITRTGSFEVTDIIMNILGTTVGATLGYILIVILKRERKIK